MAAIYASFEKKGEKLVGISAAFSEDRRNWETYLWLTEALEASGSSCVGWDGLDAAIGCYEEAFVGTEIIFRVMGVE